MGKTISRGCTYDESTNQWAVWMNKPKNLTIADCTLYNNRLPDPGECYLRNHISRKGTPMLVLVGILPTNIQNLNEFLTQMRADFTTYINKKKREAGL